MTGLRTARVSAATLSGTAGDAKLLFSMASLLTGYSVAETSGSATAEVDIYSGSADTGQLLLKITLLANESARDFPPEPFVPAPGGIYAKIVSGSATLTVFALFGV